MSEGEWTAGWIVSLPAAAVLAASAGWSAGQIGGPAAAAAAGICALVVARLIFRLIEGSGSRFRLPPFELPAFPDLPPAEVHQKEIGATNVIQLGARARPRRTPGELDRESRVQCLGQQKAAEVIPLQADASAALRDALASLKTARL